MREILFRGKTRKGIWIEGFYCPCCFGYFPCRPAIIDKNEMDSGCWKPEEVIPETVSQYTGLTDKNGTKIFEGDIVKAIDDSGTFIYKVVFINGIFGLVVKNGGYACALVLWAKNCIEVIGNIHDNPELLGGEQG